MAVEQRAASAAQARPGGSRLARLWRARWFWPLWLLAACLLLAASELLWLWHSWPVRELLDQDPPAGGTA